MSAIVKKKFLKTHPLHLREDLVRSYDEELLHPAGVRLARIMNIFIVVLPIIAAYSLYTYLVNDNCTGKWNEEQFKGLNKDIQLKLYGQHIAQDMVQRHLRQHLLDENPKKALVLAFHGTTGCGKNYLTKIVADKLIPGGLKNSYVQHWIPKHHFSDSNKILQYQDELRNAVIQKLKGCKRSFFIFDEANEIPPGLLDVLSSCFVKKNAWLSDQDCTKATFILISNTGAAEINRVVRDANLISKKRSELKLDDFQSLITKGVFNETAGFHYNHLTKRNIVDHYIPFLPLEKIHVKQCIEYFLKSHDCPFSIETLDLADEISYVHEFSAYGCRGVEAMIKSSFNNDCVHRAAKAL